MPLANSLYCCAGGFSTGATQAGHTVKLAVDNSEEALACHTDNHPKTEHLLLELGDATHDCCEVVELGMQGLDVVREPLVFALQVGDAKLRCARRLQRWCDERTHERALLPLRRGSQLF